MYLFTFLNNTYLGEFLILLIITCFKTQFLEMELITGHYKQMRIRTKLLCLHLGPASTFRLVGKITLVQDLGLIQRSAPQSESPQRLLSGLILIAESPLTQSSSSKYSVVL